MFEILIFAILFFILFPVVRVIFTLWKTVRKVKKQYQDFGNASQGQSSSSYSSNRTSRNTEKSKKKVFDRSDGEYVEFEEIKAERNASTTPPQSTESYSESQVSDVKFEEVK